MAVQYAKLLLFKMRLLIILIIIIIIVVDMSEFHFMMQLLVQNGSIE